MQTAVGFNFPGLYRRVFFASRWWQRVADSVPADPQTAVRPPRALAPARLRKINITNQSFGLGPEKSAVIDCCYPPVSISQTGRLSVYSIVLRTVVFVTTNKKIDVLMVLWMIKVAIDQPWRNSQCWLEVIPSLYLSGLRLEQICGFVAVGVH